MKKNMLSKEESISLRKLCDIDPAKNARDILNNPASFFHPHIKDLHHPVLLIAAKFSIYSILKKIDSTTSIGEETSKYFMEKYTLQEWLDKLIAFYTYCVEIIDFLITQHDDTMLDLYNDGHMNKKTLEKTMATFQESKKQLSEDRYVMTGLTKEIEKEKERIERNGYF